MLYKITLKPTGSFYFGGENSFGEAKFRGDDEKSITKNYFAKRSAYFAKGEMFPQQTQVLGMLRKEIMRKKGYLKLHNSGECIVKGKKAEAVKNIGLNWKENLGKIEQVSPLALEKEGDIFVPAPYDEVLSLVKMEGTSYINGRKSIDSAYAFKKEDNTLFGAKDFLSDAYISNTSSMKLDDVFTPITRIGNQTLGYTDDDEEQLYKMTSYSLSNTVHFVTYVRLEENIFNCDINHSYENFVELGGERSSFKLTIDMVESEPNYQNIYEKYAKNENRIVLMSDTYVSNKIFSMIEVSLSEKVSFRTIDSSKNGFSKSSKCILLKKGTVFYPLNNRIDEICQEIEKEKEFRNIGYNQYIKIDKIEG